MKIKELLSDQTNFTAGRRERIQFIVIHYTGNKGDTAANNAKYFTGKNRGASAHYFVDEKEIYKTVNNGDTAWHCGAKNYIHPKCRNSNSLGVELCSDFKDGKFYFTEETINNAVLLVKELIQVYRINSDNVLRHYDVTGKICPAPMVSASNQKDSEETKLWLSFKEKLND